MSSEYKVEHRKHGIVIVGPLPVTDMVGITAMAEARGYNLIAPSIAMHLRLTYNGRVSIVLCSDQSLVEWEGEIDEAAAKRPWPHCWLEGSGLGISALTLYRILSGEPDRRLGRFHTAPPSDEADMMRCVQMLQVAPPEWMDHLDSVADEHPEWAEWVERIREEADHD